LDSAHLFPTQALKNPTRDILAESQKEKVFYYSMQTTSAYQREESRYHYLDALRAFALLLGVFFHIAESFCPERYSWAIVDNHAYWAFDLFQNTCHSFRMELFFMIAGFFAHLLIVKRGAAGYAINRVKRILVPLLLFWPILMSFTAGIWFWGAKVAGRLSEEGYPEFTHHLAPWKMSIGIWSKFTYVVENFSLLHLWFLYYLILFYAVSLIIILLARRFPNVFGPLSAWNDRVFRKAVGSRFNIVLLALPLLPCLLLMKRWTVDTPNASLIPQWGPVLLYGVIFFMGWFLHKHRDLVVEYSRNWLIKLVVALALIVSIYWLGDIMDFFGVRKNFNYSESRLIYFSLYAVSMTMFIMGFTGLFRRFTSKTNAAWRYVADSSYWIYIAHIPLVSSLDVLIANLDYPALVKYGMECLITFPILFVSYHFLVRSTPIGILLNGRRYPFVSPWGNRTNAIENEEKQAA
jgi:glucans biosynthesis protein C